MIVKARGGVRLFGTLFVVFNVLSLFTAMGMLSQGAGNFSVAVQPLVGLIAGIGILKLNNWARWLSVLLAGYSAIYAVISLAKSPIILNQSARPLGMGIFGIALMWHICILWYFLRPGVRTQFMSKES